MAIGGVQPRPPATVNHPWWTFCCPWTWCCLRWTHASFNCLSWFHFVSDSPTHFYKLDLRHILVPWYPFCSPWPGSQWEDKWPRTSCWSRFWLKDKTRIESQKWLSSADTIGFSRCKIVFSQTFYVVLGILGLIVQYQIATRKWYEEISPSLIRTQLSLPVQM